MIRVLIIVFLLSGCASKFDGFDPSTSMVRWILTHDSRN
jgi:uncharacterized protein YceK